MPPKRSTPLDDPPSASYDDDYQSDHQQQKPPKTQQSSSSESEETTDSVKKSLQSPEDSSSEDQSESESESQEKAITSLENPKSSSDFDSEPEFSSPTASAFTIKPSKTPISLQTPLKKPISNPPAFQQNSKKTKLSNGDDVLEEKRSTIKRVWSDEDELVLLQGFIDYLSENNRSPLSNNDGFHAFITDSLPGHVSKNQLYEKVKRLKKKFQVNIDKLANNGKDQVFSKPHERKLFELSNKIWGSEDVNLNAKKISVKGKVKPKEEHEEMCDQVGDFETLYPHWNVGLSSKDYAILSISKGSIELIKKNASLIGKNEAREMEERWKGHFEEAIALRAKRIKLTSEVCELGLKI